MRNLKRALSLALASVMLVGMMVVGSSAASFPDVDDSNNVEAIAVLEAVKVMIGNEKGDFEPDKNVTRNEMAVIMAKLILGTYEADSYVGSHPFTDVPDWASKYVAACYSAGIIAGRGEGIYDGNSTVTAVEAAAMMLRALGYEDLSKGAAQWDQPVAAKANAIELFDGLTGASNTPMDRDSVAKLALNALQADVVTTEKEGDIEIPGTITIPGKITYTVVESSASWADAIDNTKGTGSDKFTVQLGEKLYKGDLEKFKDDDAFGRPATVWEYKSDEVVTVADTADASYTVEVKSETIYKDLSLGKNVTASKVTDGKDDGTFKVEKSNDTDKLGGNGVLVEAYKDSNGAVTITVINPYIGEVAKVTEAKGNDDRTVTVDGMKFETEGFDVDDVVVYTKAYNGKTYDIKSMFLAEIVDGVEVTRVKGDSEFTAGGETYKYVKSEDFTFDANDIKVDNTLDLYLDSYGYVVKVKVSDGVTSYAYVLDTGTDNSRFGSGTPYAKLLLTDGSVVEAKLDKDDYGTDIKNAADNGALESALEAAFKGYIVEYSKNSKDVYKLEAKSAATALVDKSIAVDSGKAKMTLDTSTVYADSKTIFLVDDGDDNYTVYTGYDAVPDMEATNTATVNWYCKTGTVATVVYVKGVDTGADHILFLLGKECGKKITSKDGDDYYECPAVLDGEIVDVKLDEAATANALYSRVYYSNADEEIIDLSKTLGKAFTDDPSKDEYQVSGVLTKKLSNGNITVKPAGAAETYAVADGVKVFEYSDEITSSRIGSVDEGTSVRVIVKDGKISNVFFATGESGDGPTGDATVDVNILAVLDDGREKVTFLATGTNKLSIEEKKAAVKDAYVKANSRFATESNTEVKYELIQSAGNGYNVYVSGTLSATYFETDVIQTAAVPSAARLWEDLDMDDPRDAKEWGPLVKSGFLSTDAKFTPTGEIEENSAPTVKVTGIKWNTNFGDKVPGFFYVVGGSTEPAAHENCTIKEAYFIQEDGTLKGTNSNHAEQSGSGKVDAFAIIPIIRSDYPDGDHTTFQIVFRGTGTDAGKFFGPTGDEIVGGKVVRTPIGSAPNQVKDVLIITNEK